MPPIIDPFNYIMSTQRPLMRVYKHQLKKATHHVINQSYHRITNACQARVLLLLSKSPGHRIKEAKILALILVPLIMTLVRGPDAQ